MFQFCKDQSKQRKNKEKWLKPNLFWWHFANNVVVQLIYLIILFYDFTTCNKQVSVRTMLKFKKTKIIKKKNINVSSKSPTRNLKYQIKQKNSLRIARMFLLNWTGITYYRKWIFFQCLLCMNFDAVSFDNLSIEIIISVVFMICRLFSLTVTSSKVKISRFNRDLLNNQ